MIEVTVAVFVVFVVGFLVVKTMDDGNRLKREEIELKRKEIGIREEELDAKSEYRERKAEKKALWAKIEVGGELYNEHKKAESSVKEEEKILEEARARGDKEDVESAERRLKKLQKNLEAVRNKCLDTLNRTG